MTTIEFAPTTTVSPVEVPFPAPVEVEQGWHDDPFDQHELRYHDGNGWTEHVTHLGPVPCQGCHPYAR